jgi:acetyl-CoA carboxylase carboxyltransferase component
LPTLDDYAQKALRARRRGTVYPFELVPVLTRSGGTFTEYDLDDDGTLVPVDRPFGDQSAGIVIGVVRTITDRYPEGMVRVAIFGDPTKALGAIAEPECVRIIAALDLAAEMDVPVEWLAVSAGAKISMDSGTEHMDWISRVLRRLITFTQAGGEVNVLVAGINVGAQPYFNAEATMLLHTRGILVMTPDSAMVLTGKQALDYSGGVSAEDNFGIGGYDRIMGPNGQAQYWAADLAAACAILFAHYDHTYVAPGERFPRRAVSIDPVDRDVRSHPHHAPDSDFRTVGDIFSMETNPERKKPFDIRAVMRAVADQDHQPLERWAAMADAEGAVVFDAHLGGYPVCLLGIESRPLRRSGFLPADGPDQWTAGTLFPRSSKKMARAINAASGNRPLVVLANLSGFDGSPESLRKLQLEYGAEIGRAVVNFEGPIVFCVVSRYHGGAFVVFSGALNDNMEVIAVEGSYASVIGGAPAAATVFARDVSSRTDADPRVVELEARLDGAEGDERARLRVELAGARAIVRSEKLGEVAAEFDRVHTVERALRVGSIDAIIPAARLRPHLIEALERGMRRTLE